MTFYDDLDKACCFVAKRKYVDIKKLTEAMRDTVDDLNQHRKYNHQELFFSEFFTVRIFKKGTVHLEFRDMELCHKFNVAAAKGKMWIGDGS